MKARYIAAIAVTAMITVLALMPQLASSQSYTRVPFENIEVKAPAQTARDRWLDRLVQCESSGNPNAINGKDVDGTPSYGLLQFKPSTFRAFAKAYGITGELMDPEAQRAIVRRMMDDATVNWLIQFPDCVANHIGFPPRK